MAGLGDLLGPGSTIEQMFVYNIVGQVLQAVTAPYLTLLQTDVQSATPVQPLSPADSATAANRSFMSIEDATAEAAKQGINPDRFQVLRELAGNAPAPEELATALRRGIIQATGSGPDAISFEQGIAEGNLLDKWGPVIQALAKAIPSPADIVDAVIKGQVTLADGTTLYETVGGDPDYFQLQVDIAGNPPSPGELLRLAQRGLIPWDGTGPDATTFQQGFYEGREKDKWEPIYRLLGEYYPTVGEAVELYRWGVTDQATAVGYMAQRGLTADQAQQWIEYADLNAINEYRGLTEGSVLQMTGAGIISDAQATTLLTALHKGPGAISELIEYAHIQRAIRAYSAAVNRIGSLYSNRKITEATARDSLNSLGIPAEQVQELMADWGAIAAINVKQLSAYEIGTAYKYSVINADVAQQELINIGYTPYDAWIVVGLYNEGPLPTPQPPPGPAPLAQVVPGTT